MVDIQVDFLQYRHVVTIGMRWVRACRDIRYEVGKQCYYYELAMHNIFHPCDI